MAQLHDDICIDNVQQIWNEWPHNYVIWFWFWAIVQGYLFLISAILLRFAVELENRGIIKSLHVKLRYRWFLMQLGIDVIEIDQTVFLGGDEEDSDVRICYPCDIDNPAVDDDDDCEERPSCWICLCNGPLLLKSGKWWWNIKTKVVPLSRDCSCRGSAGYVHLSCISTYAKKRTRQWRGEEFNKLGESWACCHLCKQPYQNEFALGLARDFAAFADPLQSKFDTAKVGELLELASRVSGEDKKAILRRIYLMAYLGKITNFIKLEAYSILLERLWRDDDWGDSLAEATELADKKLTLIEKMKAGYSEALPQPLLKFEADVYMDLGNIAMEWGTKEGAKKALTYYDKYVEMCKELDYGAGISIAKLNIAVATSFIEDRNITSLERLEHYRENYKFHANQLGQENVATLDSGLSLGIALQNAKKEVDAQKLLSKLGTISNQVHGPKHNMSEKIAAARCVIVNQPKPIAIVPRAA